MERQMVFKALDTERKSQDQKWGTIEEHPHEVGAWLTILRGKLLDAERAWMKQGGDDAALAEIIDIGAVAVACLEQHL